MPLEKPVDMVKLDKFICEFGINSKVSWMEHDHHYSLEFTHTNCNLIDLYIDDDKNSQYQYSGSDFSFELMVKIVKEEGVGGLNIGNRKIWYYCGKNK